MRLLTLNTHSRPEEAMVAAATIAQWITEQKIDLVALQEVNQSRSAKVVDGSALLASGCCMLSEEPPSIGDDNFAWVLAQALQKHTHACRWCYVPVKIGYGVYDEGLALFWLGEVVDFHVLPVSATRDYADWRRRDALGIRLRDTWFYTVHTARWDDEKEPFLHQWRTLHRALYDKGRVFLLGDFNVPAHDCGQGYDRMIADGWIDAFTAAAKADGYATAFGAIDGWKDATAPFGQRIDYILTNDRNIRFLQAGTVFDQTRGEGVVSDHCGVFWEWEERAGG